MIMEESEIEHRRRQESPREGQETCIGDATISGANEDGCRCFMLSGNLSVCFDDGNEDDGYEYQMARPIKL
jgi:hypothetical protein